MSAVSGAAVMRKILIAQLILAPVVAAAFLLSSEARALAALYGGGISIGNSLLMARRIARASEALSRDPTKDVRSMYLGAIERFAFTLGALALGMGWLRLEPVALLVGFACGYLGHPLSRFLPPPESKYPGG